MKEKVAAFVLFIGLITFVSAQNIDDTLVYIHSPKKATIMSACLPGLGQGYNKKYWKIPIIYAGLGGASYSAIFNYKQYQTYRKAYIARLDTNFAGNDNFPRYTTTNLLDLKNYYRRNLDLSLIVFTAVYVLNIIDAAVDAHLYDFKISNDLSMTVQPTFIHFQNRDFFSGGLSLRFNF